jgi:phosphoribosyl 1,2-cyclic phosphate phosphodiesterase
MSDSHLPPATGPAASCARQHDLQSQLVFLGTGTSHGVPVIGCQCSTCTSPNPKNQRTRCSVVLELPQGNLLIDTPPDLRAQLLREGIGQIHAVLYTHEHADHLFGLDDLRIFAQYLGRDLPVYCDLHVEKRIRNVFDYAFDPITREYPAGGVPRLEIRRVVVGWTSSPSPQPDGLEVHPTAHSTEPVEVLGIEVVPVPLQHGRYPVLGYRFGNAAYCTDTNGIPPSSVPLLEGLDLLVLDCLRRTPHPTHFSLDEAVETARRLGARRTLFTHICHDLEHEATNSILPPGMELAYDGMRLGLNAAR